MAKPLSLAREVLDKQIVDEEGWRMGRVDGVALVVGGDGPPEVVGLEVGFVVLAGRIHPRLVGAVRWLRRWGVRRTARYVIPWARVLAVTSRNLKVGVRAAETPAEAWEEWLNERVLTHFPGTAQRVGSRNKGKPPRLPKVEGP